MTIRTNLEFFGRVLQKPQLSSRLMAVGLAVTMLFIAIAFLSPLLVALGLLADPQDSITFAIHEPPSFTHWFGTSREGYDVFSRTLAATQAAFQVVIAATLISLFIGVPLGMLSGYLGGNLDRALLFFMDTIYTLPGLLLSIVLSFIVGRGIFNANAKPSV